MVFVYYSKFLIIRKILKLFIQILFSCLCFCVKNYLLKIIKLSNFTIPILKFCTSKRMDANMIYYFIKTILVQALRSNILDNVSLHIKGC